MTIKYFIVIIQMLEQLKVLIQFDLLWYVYIILYNKILQAVKLLSRNTLLLCSFQKDPEPLDLEHKTKTPFFFFVFFLNLDLLRRQSTFSFRCKQQYSLWTTFYLLKVGFDCDLQLLEVGGSQLTLQFTVGKSQRPLSAFCSGLNQISLGEDRVLPQSIFLLSTLLFQLQDPLFEPVNNLEHILKTRKGR